MHAGLINSLGLPHWRYGHFVNIFEIQRDIVQNSGKIDVAKKHQFIEIKMYIYLPCHFISTKSKQTRKSES